MKQTTTPATITKVEVENFELNQAINTKGRVLAQTFEIAFGCDYSNGTTDQECRDMKAPYADVEGFFNAAGYGAEFFNVGETEIENERTLNEFLAEALFSEQIQFFSAYVKNRLETEQITAIGKGIIAAVHSITTETAA